jgi:plastocyanin
MKKRKTRLFFIFFIFLGSVLLGLIVGILFLPKYHIVNLTKDGFDPDTIVIAKGDRITWKNSDTRKRWPSSNSHPTHEEYKTSKKGCIGSALDACRGLRNGETYSFVFDNEGVFGMHDHFLPGDTMSVKVVNKISYLFNLENKRVTASTQNIIPPEPSKFRKLDYEEQRLLVRRLAKKDPAAAWKYLKEVSMENGEVVISSPHEFSHMIGREIFRQDGFDGIKICSKDFAFGCFHGVSEQMFLTSGKNSLPLIEKECIRLYPPTAKQKIKDPGCIHGMGHGILTLNNLDVASSLTDCDKLGIDYRTSCWDGVFMEYSASDASSFDPKDPWKFCNGFASNYQEKCASYIGQLYIKTFPFNTKTFADMCMQTPHKRLEVLCVRWIGYMVAENSGGSFDKIVNECKSTGRKDVDTFCMIGAAQEIEFQRYSNWRTLASSICSEVPEEYTVYCNSYEAD